MSEQLERWNEGYDDRLTILNFLDWCEQNGIWLALKKNGRFEPLVASHTEVFYRYYRVDPVKLEEERRAVLEKQREANKARRY